MSNRPSALFIISLLGSLSVISPFAIDMYLPAFPQVAADFNVPSAMISLTLSSYFIGLAIGQLFYGPLLDRFGRKKPLAFGLGVFILASIGCGFSPNLDTLVVLRFIQALGGCAAGVASLAMVRDFFPVQDTAKILSRLFLFIAVSPLLAPTIGGFMILAMGWKYVFIILGVMVACILALVLFLLPEGHVPDASISLKPKDIILEYLAIIKHPRFTTYAFAGAFSFAGLFTYVAGSPIIFMDDFHLSATTYSMIFAVLAMGFIGGSQVNVALLRRYSSETIFAFMLKVQATIGIIFALIAWAGVLNLPSTLVLLFVFLSCVGITYPNAAALALAPFSKNAGSASASLGFLQLGVGAFISTGISLLPFAGSVLIIGILASTACIGLLIFTCGRKRAQAAPITE